MKRDRRNPSGEETHKSLSRVLVSLFVASLNEKQTTFGML